RRCSRSPPAEGGRLHGPALQGSAQLPHELSCRSALLRSKDFQCRSTAQSSPDCFRSRGTLPQTATRRTDDRHAYVSSRGGDSARLCLLTSCSFAKVCDK